MTQHAIEKIIREAIERGEFDNLPGTGKPLDLSDADDPDWWVKRLIKREHLDTSGGLPGVFGLRRERESFPESLLDLTTEASVREVLEDYNRRVKVDRISNLPAKGAAMPVIAPLVDVDAMVARWAARRAELLAQAQAAAATVRAVTASTASSISLADPDPAESDSTEPNARGTPTRRTRRGRWWRPVRIRRSG